MSGTILSVLLLSAFAAAAAPSSSAPYYAIEDIPLPPGEVSCDGVAFMPDGRLACCLSLSKIYMYHPVSKRWQLYADGLHTPLGILAVSNSEIIVAQRPELTSLQDTDGDGRADYYKTVTDSFGMSGNYGEWCFGPVRDPQGNLFFSLGTGSTSGRIFTPEVRGQYSPVGHRGRMNSSVSFRGWVMRLTPDGVTEPWANGVREPNGLGFDMAGRLFMSENQGDYVGSSKLFHVRKGQFYGHAPSLVWREDFSGEPLNTPIEVLDKLRTPAAIIFPHGDMANSPGQPLCDTTGGAFGPFAGQMLIGEMDRPRIIRCLLEEVDGELQGACTPFIDGAPLLKGNNRLAFNPTDHSLWVGHTLQPPWVGESGLQRISWTGKTPLEVKEMHLTDTGFRLLFTKPVDPKTASDPKTYQFQHYFYNYQGLYGSKKYDQADVPVSKVELSTDGLSVDLTLELKAWHLYDLQLNGLLGRDGEAPMNTWLVYTLNRLRHNTPERPAPQPFTPPKWKEPELPKGGIRSVGGPTEKAFSHGEETPLRQQKTGTQTGDGPLRTSLQEGSLGVFHGDQVRLRYQAGPLPTPTGGTAYAGSNFIHPLRTPAGVSITASQPADHLHHFGLWWPWKYLKVGERTINCWELQNGDGLVQANKLLAHSGGSEATFSACSEYIDRKAPGGPTVVLKETVTATVSADINIPAVGYYLDLTITDTAAGSEPVEIASYRYSGFSLRGPPDWQGDNSSLLTSSGKNRDDANGTPATWVRIAGTSPGGKLAGVLIMTHPSNPRFPENLRVWDSKQAKLGQFANFNPVQDAPLPLPAGTTMTRRYRLLIYDGELLPDQAHLLAKQYHATATAQ